MQAFYDVFLGFEEEVEELGFSSSETICKFSDDLKILAESKCELAFVYKGHRVFIDYAETDIEVDFDNFVDADWTRFDVTVNESSEQSEVIKREVSQGLKIQIRFDRID